jgi:hypothetical protein
MAVTTEQRDGKTPGVAPKATGLKLSKSAMARRDETCLRLFLAGHSEREIGRHPSVGLTGQRVHQILKREIARGNKHRELLRDESRSVYLARLDVLLRSCWPKALSGDLKAIEVARHVIEQQARVSGALNRAPAVPTISAGDLDEFDLSDPYDRDELSRYRASHRHRQGE